MRILFLVNEFPPGPGGIGTHAYELARQLTKRGHTVTVLTSQNYATDKQIGDFNGTVGFKIHRFSGRTNPVLQLMNRISMALRIWRKTKPDVILTSGSYPTWLGGMLKLLRKTPLVVVAHGGEINFRNKFRNFMTKSVLLRADRVVSVSHYTATVVNRVIPGESAVIHHGANSDVFKVLNNKAELKSAPGIEDRFVVLTVGSLSQRKGQDLVIQAIGLLKKDYPAILYLLAGHCSDFSPYEALIREFDVADQVRYLGVVPNARLVELYNTADVFVLSGRHSIDGDFEGFGIVVIEAALCGLPAIVTSDSGLTEAIQDGETGLSVPRENISDLAKAIEKMMTDRKLLIRFSRQAQQRAESEFTWENAGLKYEEELIQVTLH